MAWILWNADFVLQDGVRSQDPAAQAFVSEKRSGGVYAPVQVRVVSKLTNQT